MTHAKLNATLRAALIKDGRDSFALAKITGLHPVTIRRFRSSTRGLSLASAAKLGKALGIKVTLGID